MNYSKRFNPVDYPIIYHESDYAQQSAWWGHVPFAKWIVEVVSPNILVELGTHYGVSYVSFCEAANFLDINSEFFAVDTWLGDSQAGFYGEEVLETLINYHDRRFGAFSTLLRKTFDQALNDFNDHSINLLHIDGFHSYEQVKHDFECWLPKIAKGGIVLLHDTNHRGEGFGVWKLWNEVSKGRKCFEFLHSHGLGVLAIDDNYPDELNLLFDVKEENADQIRMFFQFAGNYSTSRYKTLVTEKVIHSLQAEIHSIPAQFERNERRIIRLEQHFNHLLTAKLQKFLGRFFPPGSRRRKFLRIVYKKERS